MSFVEKAKSILFHRGPVDLGDGHVLSSLARLSVPSIGMVLFQTLFNLVDTIFISWLGESHMVAISYTFPVQIGVFALLEGVGNGVTALVGRRLGENDVEAARRTARCGLVFAYVLSLVWLPFLFPGPSNAFFRMLGASDPETLRQAWLYNMWIPPMTVVIAFTYIVNSIFRCQGDTMTPLRFFLVANSLNFVLDPLFIFVFGWGMTGAAAATFIGRAAGAVYLIRKMRRDSAIQIPLFAAPRREMLPIWRAVAAIGLPVTLSTGSVARHAAPRDVPDMARRRRHRPARDALDRKRRARHGLGQPRAHRGIRQRRDSGLDDFAARRGYSLRHADGRQQRARPLHRLQLRAAQLRKDKGRNPRRAPRS